MKIGDKVRIKDNIKNTYATAEDMLQYQGREATIIELFDQTVYLDIDSSIYCWWDHHYTIINKYIWI